EELAIRSVFIELTERRNLFAHCGGHVSNQYITVCKQHGIATDRLPDVGTRLSVDRKYVSRAYACLFEMAVKLTHVLWRKLLPNELKQADRSLNNIIFELIVTEQYSLAITMGKFGTEILKKHSNDEIRLFMKLNLAQAYKWNVSDEKCREVVSKEDWSSRGNHIRLAVALLNDDYQEAVKFMKRIGRSDEVEEHDYKDWPIFRDFRRRPEFLEAFQEIYGKPFAPIEKIIARLNTKWEDLKVDYVYESDIADEGCGSNDYSI